MFPGIRPILLSITLACSLISSAYSTESSDFDEFCAEYREYKFENEPVGETAANAAKNKTNNNEFAKGLLWKIESQTGKESYLFGTIHSQDRLVTLVPPDIRLALAKSRTLLIETILDEQSNRIFFDSIFFHEDDERELTDFIEAPVYKQLETIIPDYGVSAEQLPKLKPWAAFILIGKPKPVNATTLDMILIQLAQSHNKEIVGIETINELIEPMSQLDIRDQAIILNDTVCNHSQIIKDSWELLQLYLAKDLEGMLLFNEGPHYDEAIFERYIQKILYERNEKMFDRIIPYLDRGSTFIAVGASHLAGDKGLLKKLKDKQYKITKLY